MALDKKKKRRIRLIVVLSITVVLIAGLVINYVFFTDKTLHITAVTAVKSDIEQFVSLKGTVLASEEELLFAPSQVTVQAVHVKKGDIVQEGDLIAEFDVADLKNSYNQSSLQYANAKLAYEDALRSNEENEEKAIFYQRRLRNTQDEIDSLDEMNDAAEIADLKADLAEYKGERKSAIASIMSDEKIAQLKNSMDLAAISVNSANKYLKEGRAGIAAGISGVITELTLSEGGMTSSATPCVVIQSLQTPVISFSLGKYDLDRIKVGQTVNIGFGSMQYPGHVSRIDAITTLEGTSRVVKAEITFDTLPEHVVLGIEADLSILTDSARSVVVLPFEVLRTDRDGNYCMVVEDGIIKKAYVELGIGSDTHSEIVSGLSEGAVVVHTSPITPAEGLPVTIDTLS